MSSSTNVHRVKAMKVSQHELPNTGYWITEVVATNASGDTFTFTMFHQGLMPVEGAELVNFVAGDAIHV